MTTDAEMPSDPLPHAADGAAPEAVADWPGCDCGHKLVDHIDAILQAWRMLSLMCAGVLPDRPYHDRESRLALIESALHKERTPTTWPALPDDVLHLGHKAVAVACAADQTGWLFRHPALTAAWALNGLFFADLIRDGATPDIAQQRTAAYGLATLLFNDLAAAHGCEIDVQVLKSER